MEKIKFKTAEFLVGIANRLIDTDYPTSSGQGYCQPDRVYGGGWHPIAYSYAGLKSFVEQDGPEGFGAKATIKWLISDDGWEEITKENWPEVRRNFAIAGIDVEEMDDL